MLVRSFSTREFLDYISYKQLSLSIVIKDGPDIIVAGYPVGYRLSGGIPDIKHLMFRHSYSYSHIYFSLLVLCMTYTICQS